jgi:hypothetical protein
MAISDESNALFQQLKAARKTLRTAKTPAARKLAAQEVDRLRAAHAAAKEAALRGRDRRA